MKTRFLPDTSCIVAAVSGWHEDHEAARGEIERRLSSEEELVSAAPALIEAYAVLTRLPAPHRLAPPDALDIIEAGFIARRRVVALGHRDYVQLLRDSPARGVLGGRSYDAVIAECARLARATVLLTFNDAHFRQWQTDQLAIVVPAARARS